MKYQSLLTKGFTTLDRGITDPGARPNQRNFGTVPPDPGSLGHMMIGCHVDSAAPLASAVEFDVQVAQFFLSDPQSWKAPVIDDAWAADLRAEAETTGITLVVHSPYIINVASTNNRIRIPSRKLLQQIVNASAKIGASVVVHGGHVTGGDDPAMGYENWAKCVAGLELATPVLIENTAGGTKAMARTIDQIQQLWDAILTTNNGTEIGFCLDTCHAHAGGNNLPGLVSTIKNITGRIDALHLNNSRDAFGSGADRHASLTNGQINPTHLIDVVRDANCPIILETPPQTLTNDLDWLRAQLRDRN